MRSGLLYVILCGWWGQGVGWFLFLVFVFGLLGRRKKKLWVVLCGEKQREEKRVDQDQKKKKKINKRKKVSKGTEIRNTNAL